MARRKRHKKTTHRRRRVGAIHAAGAMEAVKCVGGVFLGIVVGKVVNNMLSTTSGTILGGAEAAAGVLGVMKLRGSLLKGVATGVAANGAFTLLGSKGLAVLPASIGYGPDPMHRYTRPQMQGFREVPKIGFPKPNAIGAARDKNRMHRIYAGVYG